jgi:hypothetical protein
MEREAWTDLASTLANSFSDAHVNLIYDEFNPNDVAIEMCARGRTFDAFPAPPSKWTVLVFTTKDMVSAAILKMGRQVLEQRDFDVAGAAGRDALVEYLQTHPFLKAGLVYCRGIRSAMEDLSKHPYSVDHFAGREVKRSRKCELVIPRERDMDLCDFCTAVNMALTVAAVAAAAASVKKEAPSEEEEDLDFLEPEVSLGEEEEEEDNGNQELELDYEDHFKSNYSKIKREFKSEGSAGEDEEDEEDEEEESNDEDYEYDSDAPIRRKKKGTLEKKLCAREKTLSCPVCGKAFSHKGHFAKHMKVRHGQGDNEEEDEAGEVKGEGEEGEKKEAKLKKSKPPKEKTLKCQICDKAFALEGYLERHMHQHKGEPGVVLADISVQRRRPYRPETGKFNCHLCGVVLSRASKYYHLRSVHKIGFVTHKCYCGKEYASKLGLKKHHLSHTGEKPFIWCVVIHRSGSAFFAMVYTGSGSLILISVMRQK